MSSEINISPARGVHSIVQCALAIEWDAQLDVKAFQAIRSSLEKSEPLLKRLTVLQPVLELKVDAKLKVDGSSNKVTMESGNLSGLEYKDSATAPTRILTIGKQFAAYIVNTYTRWNPLRDEALPLLTEVHKSIKAISGIERFIAGVEYVDEFIVGSAGSEFIPNQLFNQDCPYLPSACFKSRYYWDNSWSSPTFGPQNVVKQEQASRLAVAVLDKQNLMVARIISSEKTPFKLATDGDINLFLSQAYDALHAEHKQKFQATITSEIRSKIGLR